MKPAHFWPRFLVLSVALLTALLVAAELVGAGSSVAFITVEPEAGSEAWVRLRTERSINLTYLVDVAQTTPADPYASTAHVGRVRGAVRVTFLVRRGAQVLRRVSGRVEEGQSMVIRASRWRLTMERGARPDP